MYQHRKVPFQFLSWRCQSFPTHNNQFPRMALLRSKRSGKKSIRYLFPMYWAALLYGLSAVLILSCTAITIPTAYPAAQNDLSGTWLDEPDGFLKRTIHLTARPNWKFQTGVWSVNFLKLAVFPVAQANLVELYHDVMALTEPFAHQTPQGRYFQYNFGRLALIFESQDSHYIPWKVIYDFAQQAIDRADRGLVGLYSGVSPISNFLTPKRRAFLVPNTPGT